MRQQEENKVEDQRLNAVKEAFWGNTPQGHDDFDELYDVLVDSEIVKDPTPEQIKAFFMKLPADIIGSALSWGFSDTEVRESTYAFVQQNKQTVLEAVGKAEDHA